jgi:hypothetical protein
MDYLATTGYYVWRIIKDRLCWCFRANKLPAASSGVVTRKAQVGALYEMLDRFAPDFSHISLTSLQYRVYNRTCKETVSP